MDNKLQKYFLSLTSFDEMALDIFSDDKPENISESALVAFYGHFPAGTSSKAIKHLL